MNDFVFFKIVQATLDPQAPPFQEMQEELDEMQRYRESLQVCFCRRFRRFQKGGDVGRGEIIFHGNPSYPPQSYPPKNKALLRVY